MKDQVRIPSGRVGYSLVRDGAIVEIVDEPNLVVSLATSILASAIGAGSAADGVVTQFGGGTNLLAPAPGNITLTGAYLNALAGNAYPAPGEVVFSFALGSAEANGISIGEFGLLTAGGRLFARKVRQAALLKDATISISGTWTITW